MLRFTATCKNWTQSRAPLHEQYRHHQTQMSVKHIWRHMSLQSNFTMVIYLKKSKEDITTHKQKGKKIRWSKVHRCHFAMVQACLRQQTHHNSKNAGTGSIGEYYMVVADPYQHRVMFVGGEN